MKVRNPMLEDVTRSVEFRALEIPEGEERDGLTLEGYAAVFDKETEIRSPFEGNFIERISRGAFRKTLRENKPVMQFDHGMDSRTGTVPIGVYDELREDDKGLYVKGHIFDNELVKPIADAVRAKAVTGMSVRMRVTRDEWTDNKGKRVRGDEILRLMFEPGDRGPLVRNVKEVGLREAGPVVFPAYRDTSVGLRSMEEMSQDDVEALAAEYRSEILRRDHEEAVAEWLEAERSWKEDCEVWLEAERKYRDDCRAWVEAERVFQDTQTAKKKKDKEFDYADPGYQDDGKKRYPLHTKDHVKAAWSYINMPKNAKKYSPEELKKIKARIRNAAKKFGIVLSENKSEEDNAGSITRATLSPEDETPEDAGRTTTSRRESQVTQSKTDRKVKMNLEEIRARLLEIASRMGEIDEEFRDATLSDDAQTEFDELNEERADLIAKETKILERRNTLEELASRVDHVRRGDSKDDERRSSAAFHRKTDIYDLDSLRKESYSSDDFVERATDNARKALENLHFPDTVQGKEADAREGLDRFLTSRDSSDGELAKRILMTGSPLYERAFGKAVMRGNLNGLDQDELRAMGTATDAAGNFAVPIQLDPTLVHLGTGYIAPIRQLARKVQLVGKEWQTLTITEATVYRAAEAAAAIDGSPTLASQTVRVNKVHGFIPFSMEVDEDWPGMRAELSMLLNEAKAKEEATAFMTGTGTPPQPQGVLVGATTTVSAGTGLTIVAADLYKVEEALPIEFRDRAVWLTSKSIMNKIRAFDTQGGPNLWVRIEEGVGNRLLGYPVYEASVGFPATSTFTNGQKLAIFGDFSNFVIIDRIGMSIELIPHLFDPTTNTPTGQRGLYAHWRNTSKVTNPNAFRVLTATT